MPQNASQVLVGLNSGTPKALAVDASGSLVQGAGKAVDATVATGTIAVTNTFQSCLAANTARLPGGSITNNGTNVMQVFIGAGTASAAKAIDLAGGATLYLSTLFGAGQAYLGAIQITGTAADTFATIELTAAA